MSDRKSRPAWLAPKILVILSVACFLVFVFSASRAFAATTYNVKVGGEYMGPPLAQDGMVWFNGYDPSDIVIHPGDTITWNLVGGVHTVTSDAMANATAFLFDSSPLLPVEAALADLGPGLLLPPGTIYEFDTSGLAPGTYQYLCKIHSYNIGGTWVGMVGNVTVSGFPSPRPETVDLIAGWGDHLYAVQGFAPADITVTPGTIVRWTLLNPMEPHTITGFNSTGGLEWDSSPNFNPPGPPPVMLPGDSFSRPFNTPGTFVYFCKLHAYKIGGSWVGMTAVVHVVPATLDTIAYAGLGIAVVALVVSVIGLFRRRGPSSAPPPNP
jgi:plastocyanin